MNLLRQRNIKEPISEKKGLGERTRIIHVSSAADGKPIETHQHSKSSRRALFKENMSPRLKTSACYEKELCRSVLHPVQENVPLHPNGSRHSLVPTSVRDNKFGTRRAMKFARSGTQANGYAANGNGGVWHQGSRTIDNVQNNLMYGSQYQTICREREPGIYLNESEHKPVYVNRLTAANKCWIQENPTSSSIVQDNVVCNLTLSMGGGSGADWSNSVTGEREEREELAEDQIQRGPVGSGINQICSTEASDVMLAVDTFDDSQEDADIQEHSKTPEEWLVKPLQRLSFEGNTDQSECLDNTQGIMGTHQPPAHLSGLSCPPYASAHMPSLSAEQCFALVHRVEDSVIQSPASPLDEPYCSSSSHHHHQLLYEQPSDDHGRCIDGFYMPDIYPAYSSHRQSSLQRESIINTSDIYSCNSHRDYQLDFQHSLDAGIIRSKQPCGLGSAQDQDHTSASRLTQPAHPSVDLPVNGRWNAPDSDGWTVEQPHSLSGVHSQLTSPSKLFDITPKPQPNHRPDATGGGYQEFIANQTAMERNPAIEPDNDQSTQRLANSSDIRMGSNSLALSLTGSSSPVTSLYSSGSVLHSLARSSGSSDISQPHDFDLWKLDQLDDADLYQYSEGDEFVHSKPLEGFYARSSAAGLDKNCVKELGKSRSRKKVDEEKQDEDKDLCEMRTKEEPSHNWNNNIAVHNDGLQRRVAPSMKMTSKSGDGGTDRQKDSKVLLPSPSAVSVNKAVLDSKLQCSLESGILGPTNSVKESFIGDPAADTELSPLRHSNPSSPGQVITLDDLKLSVHVSPSDRRQEGTPTFSRINSESIARSSTMRHWDKNRSRAHEYASRRSVPTTRPQKSCETPGFIQSRNLVDRTSHSGNSGGTQRRNVSVKHLTGFPQPQKSAGLPKHSRTPVTPSKSPLTISSSCSPRQTLSILWAYKILDILHSASPDRHEELVTKLYWFRRWHKNVRLIKTQRDEREEQWDRATCHYKSRLLARCLRAWKLAPPCHRRAADKLRERHLLKKGLHGLRWALMQSRLEMEGAVSRNAKCVKCHHFGAWRDLYYVQTERAHLLEKLAVKHAMVVTFQTWKDRYNLAQKDSIARLHYKVNLLSHGFQHWKLFTSQSKVKGYRGEMSRVHHEEKVVQKAWRVMSVVYTQTKKADNHYSARLLLAVIYTWVRGSQLAKAERHHQHSQALELRRCCLLRAHCMRWKEESLVVRVKQRLDTVCKRFVWDLWTLRLQRQQLYRQIMESQACKVAKQYVFNRWVQVARQQKEAARRASVILRQTYLRIVFQRWRNHVNRECRLRRTLSTCISNSNWRRKQRILLAWAARLRAHQSRLAARRSWSLRCVKRAASKWRERVRCRRLEDRLVQFRPVHDEHVTRDAFKRWAYEHGLALQDHQRALSAQRKLFRNRLLRLLLSWRLLSKESKTIAPLLERRNWKQLASSFDAWRERVLRKKASKKFQSRRSGRIIETAFLTWREETAARQKIRSVQTALLTSKMTRAFHGWREEVQRRVDLKAFLKQQQDAVTRRIFDCWRKASDAEMLTREVQQGDKAREILLTTVYFNMWSTNAQQQRESEGSLVGDHRMRWSTRTIRASYQRWRRQLLVQDIARNAQADREASLVHRIFQAWHQETQSTYEQLTERFHLALDGMSMSLPHDNVNPASVLSSAPTPDLHQSLSSSSGVSQGLPADSGYGNGMGLLFLESTVSRSGEASGRLAASSDEYMYPEELQQTVGRPGIQDSKPPLKPQYRALMPSSMRSPRSRRPMSFLGRRASLDLNLPSSRLDHRRSFTSRTPGAQWGGTRSASVDQGLLSSPTVISHLRNVHRKSQTENPTLSSAEEAPDVALNSSVAGSPPSESLMISQPQSPNSHSLQASAYHHRVPIPRSTSPPPHSPPQPRPSPSLSASPRYSSGPNVSKSLSPVRSHTQPDSHHAFQYKSPSPLSPRALAYRTLSEGQSQTIADSRRSSISESSSLGLESTHSSSYYMQLVGYNLGSRSRTTSEYTPSVFSDCALPVGPQVDQTTYLQSLLLHWRLWPASAAFNQWLGYARHRRDLRELAERWDQLLRQFRLHRALMTWQRRCRLQRLAKRHWEMKTKVDHLKTWIQYSQSYQTHMRQGRQAEEMAGTKRLSSAFYAWKTKHKKHQAVLSIVHNWKGCVQQTVDLEDRTKGLRHQIQQRSLRECFKSWKVRTWQMLEVKAHRNRVITTRCLTAWASWTKDRITRREKLHSFKTKRLKQLVLHRWRSQRTKLQAVQAFHRQAVGAHLREIVRMWSSYVSMKHLGESAAARMIQERGERSVRKMWTTWKRRKQQTERTKQLYLTNLARKHLLAWYCRSSNLQSTKSISLVVENQRKTRLKHSLLQAWQAAYRASQLAQQMLARLRKKQLSRALWDWRKYTQQCRSEKFSQKRLLTWALCTWQSYCMKQKTRRLSVLRMVHHWRKQTHRSNELDQSLTWYQTQQDVRKCQKTFQCWKLAWQQHRNAAGHHNHFVMERCLSGWHTFAAIQRLQRTALMLWQTDKCKKVVVASFQKWKHSHLYCKELETRLAVLCQQRAAEMLARVMQSWHHVTMEGVAVRRHNTVLKTKTWQCWQKALSDSRVAIQRTEVKQAQVNTAVLHALLDWCQARKSQKASYRVVATRCNLRTIQAAFTFWKTEALLMSKAKRHANQVLQSKLVRAWSIAVQRSVALRVVSESTVLTCNKLRLQSAFRIWRHQLQRTAALNGCLEGALQRRDRAVLQQSFSQWRREAMSRCAARHRRKQTLKWGWSGWRQRVTDRQFDEDIAELADEHYNRRIRKNVLGLWLTETKIGRLGRKRGSRLAKQYGLLWKNGCKIAHTAASMDAYWSLQRAWIIWRQGMIQSLMSKTMQQHSERQLTEQSFKVWREEATPANNGLRRDLLNRRLYTAFRVWRGRTQAAVELSLESTSQSSSLSNHSSSAGYTSSSGASELAAIWMNAQRTGSVYSEGGN